MGGGKKEKVVFKKSVQNPNLLSCCFPTRKWLSKAFFENSLNRCLSISWDVLFVTLVHSSQEPKARGPRPSHGKGVRSALCLLLSKQALANAAQTLHLHSGSTPGKAGAIDGELSGDGVYHTRSGTQHQLTFPLGREAGVQLEWTRSGWNTSGGPAPWTMPVQKPPSQPPPAFSGLAFLLPRPLPHSLWRQEAWAVAMAWTTVSAHLHCQYAWKHSSQTQLPPHVPTTTGPKGHKVTSKVRLQN